MEPDLLAKHEKMLYPVVRVRTTTAGGSGTVIYSKQIPGKEAYETYVLTNNHVIETCILVKKQWSGLLKREVKKDVLSECTIEFFEFEYGSWEAGHRSVNAEIMAYDKDMDLALLRLRTERKADYVADMLPKDTHKEKLKMFMPLYAIGCGLGHPPLATEGNLTGFTDIIDNYPYWLSSAPTIFGNSGGAVFLADTLQYVGVPSRVSVQMIGLGGAAITHMSYFIPIISIHNFLEEQIFQFIYDPNYDSKQCAEMRKHKRERDERSMAIEMSREEKDLPDPKVINPDMK